MEALDGPMEPIHEGQTPQQETQTHEQQPRIDHSNDQGPQKMQNQQRQEQHLQAQAQGLEPQPQTSKQSVQSRQHQNFGSSDYDAVSMSNVGVSQQRQMQPQQFRQQQHYNPQHQQQFQHYHHQQQQQQQTIYNPPNPQPTSQQESNVYSHKASPFSTAAVEERATHLLAACESCLVVTRVPGVDMSFRRIMERKCPRCGGTLVLPQEVMEMLILYGNFVPESVAVTLVLGTMVLHPSLRADFMAAAMNDLLIPLQTDFVYDVAVPKRQEGLGMSLRMNQGNLVVRGFIDFENNQESPSVAARIIAVDDVLVAINKKSITSWTFEKSISMLAHAASPVYLTFRRRQPVMLL